MEPSFPLRKDSLPRMANTLAYYGKKDYHTEPWSISTVFPRFQSTFWFFFRFKSKKLSSIHQIETFKPYLGNGALSQDISGRFRLDCCSYGTPTLSMIIRLS